MATVATQNVGTGGLAAVYSAASASDKFTPGDGTALHVKNGGAGALTVTLVTPGTVDALAVADRAVTVAAGTDQFISAPSTLYANRADGGLATVQFSPITSVTFAVIRS